MYYGHLTILDIDFIVFKKNHICISTVPSVKPLYSNVKETVRKMDLRAGKAGRHVLQRNRGVRTRNGVPKVLTEVSQSSKRDTRNNFDT